jgi:hypothetical protein
MIGDIIIEVQDRVGTPYPSDYARAIEDAINSGKLPIYSERDKLWCEALVALDPIHAEIVLRRFNEARPDK